MTRVECPPPRPAVQRLRPGGGEPRALAFADAEGAKQWAHALPLTNVALVYETVQGQLKALSPRPSFPRASARRSPRCCAISSPTCTRSSRAATPASRSPRSIASSRPPSQAIALWHGLWEQYSTCLKPLLEGDPELAGRQGQDPAARAVRRQAARARRTGSRAGRVPDAVWHELHAYYRLAEMLDCAVTAVSDDLMPQRRRHLLLLDVQPRAAARARRPLRDVGEADRAHRPLARDVGAQDLSLCAAARNRGPGDPRRPRRRDRRDARPRAFRPIPRSRCASATPASSRPACADG